MDRQDRSSVLMTVAHLPGLGIRIGMQVLRAKRSVTNARRRFYMQLIVSGVPKEYARRLADDYAAAADLRTTFSILISNAHKR